MTLEDFIAELEKYKNTLVIDGFHFVARLVDVIDGEDDYYYVMDSGKMIYHSSVLIEFIPLKGFIPDDTYNRLVNVWNLNNEVKAV